GRRRTVRNFGRSCGVGAVGVRRACRECRQCRDRKKWLHSFVQWGMIRAAILRGVCGLKLLRSHPARLFVQETAPVMIVYDPDRLQVGVDDSAADEAEAAAD